MAILVTGGDPAVLVASSERAQTELGWQPRCAAICKRLSHPRGDGTKPIRI